MSRAKSVSILTSILLFGLTGCEFAREEYPAHWPKLADIPAEGCPDLSGYFSDAPDEIEGEKHGGNAWVASQISLKNLVTNNTITIAVEDDLIEFDRFQDNKYKLKPLTVDKEDFGQEIDISEKFSCRKGRLFIDPKQKGEGLRGGPYVIFSIENAKVEISKTIKGDVIGRYTAETYALISLIPVFIDVEYWLLWRDRSREIVSCSLPSFEIAELSRRQCLAIGGRPDAKVYFEPSRSN